MPSDPTFEHLTAGGVDAGTASAWIADLPEVTGDFERDRDTCGAFWSAGVDLVHTLGEPAERSPEASAAARAVHELSRRAKRAFLAEHRAALYRAMTDDFRRFVRVEDAIYESAELVPGLVPSRALVAEDEPRLLKHKEGWEYDQGVLLSSLFDWEPSGRHLLHAMLLPTADALARLDAHLATGLTVLDKATVERRGRASVVTLRNERFLNAEDDTTVPSVETAIDLALLDPATEICVLQGTAIDHPKYAGKRVFCSGVNLTHVYHGQLSYIWYLKKDLGFTNKLLYGLAKPDQDPESFDGAIEKAWIAVIESFAIGGGCQYTLVCDFVLAADDAYFTLPARKEGIVPGFGNLRLPRQVGERLARQMIMFERRVECDSPAGSLIVDRVVPAADIPVAIEETVEFLTGSGVVSTASNRRNLRVATEPLDLNRRYAATYAEEQARCHFSPALIDNLEKFWNADQRRP